MSDYCLNDYDRHIGNYITVIYDCGTKCRKLHCKLLNYCEKNSKEKLITLKTHDNTIYHINCNKIIYWTAKYDDKITEYQDTYKSSPRLMESKAMSENEDLLFEKTPDKETLSLKSSIDNIQLHDTELSQSEECINSCPINSHEECISLTSNEDATQDKLDYNNILTLESEKKIATTLEPVSNAAISLKEHDMEQSIPFKINLVSDQSNTYDKVNVKNAIQEKINHKNTYEKNFLRSPLAAFINSNFQGVYLTIYTTSAQAISGEVIFHYDSVIVLKSDGKNYYINPDQITYFW